MHSRKARCGRGGYCSCSGYGGGGYLLLLFAGVFACNTAKVTEESAPSAVLQSADSALAEKSDALTNAPARGLAVSSAAVSGALASANPLNGLQPVNAGLANLCDTLCERTRELNCSAQLSECQSQCREMASTPLCQQQLGAVFNCIIAHPASDWECVEGFAAIREEFCRGEQAAFAACMSQAP